MINSEDTSPETQTQFRSAMIRSLSESNNYYGWIISRIKPFLGKNVLDLGSGFGSHLMHILPLVERVTSIGTNAGNIDFLNQRFKKFGTYRAIYTDFQQDPLPLWMKVSGFDTIVCLDMLEHISDDLSALRDMNEILPVGEGVLILKVPAHPSFYGSMDSHAGHYRRYRKAEIAIKLEQTGYKILHIEYFNRLSALFWWLNGRIFKKKLNSYAVNSQVKLFNRFLVPVLKPLENIIALPFGQSILVAAVKQRDTYHAI